MCQYTGIEFEAKTARSKNHPAVARLLQEANRRGVYGQVMNAIVAAKNEGLVGDPVIEAGQIAMDAGLKAAAEFATARRAEQKEKARQESERSRNFAHGTRKDEEQLEQEAIRDFVPPIVFASPIDAAS